MHFDCISPQDEPDKRFHHFTTQLLPALLKSAVQSANTIVFIPSSFDFIRVHNWFRKQSGVSFAILSECVCFLFVSERVSDSSKIGTRRIKISRVPDKPFSKAQNQYYSSVSDSTFTNGTFSHFFSHDLPVILIHLLQLQNPWYTESRILRSTFQSSVFHGIFVVSFSWWWCWSDGCDL